MISASGYVAESRNVFHENLRIGSTTDIIEEELQLITSEGEVLQPVKSVVIFCDETSAIVGNVIDRRKSPSAQIVGKCLYSKLYQDEFGNLTIDVVAHMPEIVLFQWMKIINSFSPTFVLAMSSSSQILSSSAEGSLRLLVTSDITSVLKFKRDGGYLNFKNNSEVLNALVSFEMLSIGNVITGLVAVIMSYFESRSIPAVAIICSKRAAITFNALRSFEAALPILHATLGENGENHASLSKVSNQSYVEFVKKDPFALMTENLYT